MVLKAKSNDRREFLPIATMNFMDLYQMLLSIRWRDVQELWFQQDGATCHTARATIDLLKDTLGDRLISRFGPVNWPPRSCDLTPLDYFLWGYVKSLVYADKPQTLDHLEDNIRRVIADIRPQMLEKVIEHWTSRLDYIRASRGSPMPEIIFKMSLCEVWKQWTDEYQTTRKTGSGRRKVTSARDDRHLLRMAMNDYTASSRQLAARCSTATGVLMSASSIRRRLLYREFRAMVPSYRVPLTANYRWLCLQWGSSA
ncbi:transposable element Tc3 transposase [Trichonephila clavipes]|nr:transposable element Tc3 transposase [Trichonephila clavipes]